MKQKLYYFSCFLFIVLLSNSCHDDMDEFEIEKKLLSESDRVPVWDEALWVQLQTDSLFMQLVNLTDPIGFYNQKGEIDFTDVANRSMSLNGLLIEKYENYSSLYINKAHAEKDEIIESIITRESSGKTRNSYDLPDVEILGGGIVRMLVNQSLGNLRYIKTILNTRFSSEIDYPVSNIMCARTILRVKRSYPMQLDYFAVNTWESLFRYSEFYKFEIYDIYSYDGGVIGRMRDALKFPFHMRFGSVTESFAYEVNDLLNNILRYPYTYLKGLETVKQTTVLPPPTPPAAGKAPLASELFRNSKFSAAEWAIIEDMMEEMMKDCLGEALYKGLKDKLGGKKLIVSFSNSGYEFNLPSGTVFIYAKDIESNQLFHEIWHAYQSYQETETSFDSSMLNQEYEARYAQYIYIKRHPDFKFDSNAKQKFTKWESWYEYDDLCRSIRHLNKYIDDQGNLKKGVAAADLDSYLMNKLQTTFKSNETYRVYPYDHNRIGTQNFKNLKELTKNC